MIAKLTGVLDYCDTDSIIIDVNGVGYSVTVSKRLLSNLPSLKSQLCLWIETVYRQEGVILFGFDTLQERQWFRLLTTVQGVGGKMALGILGTLSPTDLVQAIMAEDKTFLTRGEGVGPKIATRIITELKDKVLKSSTLSQGQAPIESISPGESRNDQTQEALSALTNLGYNRMEAFAALQHVMKQGVNGEIEELIKQSLIYLSR